MIDFIIFILVIGFFAWLFVMLGLIIWGARALRGVCGNDTADEHAPRRKRRFGAALDHRHA